MSLHQTTEALRVERDRLARAWQSTGSAWTDSRRDRMDASTLGPLLAETHHLVDQMQRITDAVAEAQRGLR